MVKLTNVSIPYSMSMLKLTDNFYSENITERSDSEDSDNDATTSTLF